MDLNESGSKEEELKEFALKKFIQDRHPDDYESFLKLWQIRHEKPEEYINFYCSITGGDPNKIRRDFFADLSEEWKTIPMPSHGDPATLTDLHVLTDAETVSSVKKDSLLGEDEDLIIDISEDSGTLLETGSTPKEKVKPLEGSRLIADGDSKEELILENGAGETLLQTDAVEKPTQTSPRLPGRRDFSGETKTIVTKPSEEEEKLLKKGSIFKDVYRVGAEIARGGMGAVIKLTDLVLKKDWALKIGLPGSDEERFLNEAYFTAQLEHPGIAPAIEAGVVDAQEAGIKGASGDIHYFIQKLVKGKTLGKILNELSVESVKESEWDVTRFLEVISKVCETLEYAHLNDVIHRDLKPDNIMIGSHDEVFVMDWGLAKYLEDKSKSFLLKAYGRAKDKSKTILRRLRTRIFGRESKEEILSESELEKTKALIDSKLTNIKITDYTKTITGDIAGTPGYMPPEQADGDVEKQDGRADVYALGAILYKILTFKAPFESRGNVRQMVYATLMNEPEPISENWAWGGKPDKVLESIVKKAMAKEIDERYVTVRHLLDDIKKHMRHESVSVHEYGLMSQLTMWNKRKHNIPAIAGSLILILGTIGGGISSYLSAQKAKAEGRARIAAEGRVKDAEVRDEIRYTSTEANNIVKFQNDPESAIDLLTNLIKKYSNQKKYQHLLALPFNNRGAIILDDLENPDTALIDLERATQLDGDYATGWYNQARCHVRLGNIEEALSCFGRAINLKPKNSRFYQERALTIYWKKEEWKKALEDFLVCTRLAPKEPDNWFNAGDAYRKLGDNLNAEHCFEEAHKRGLANASGPLVRLYIQNEHFYKAGELYHQYKRDEDAKKYLSLALQRGDHPEEAQLLLDEIAKSEKK